jgi:hypothetical protein
MMPPLNPFGIKDQTRFKLPRSECCFIYLLEPMPHRSIRLLYGINEVSCRVLSDFVRASAFRHILRYMSVSVLDKWPLIELTDVMTVPGAMYAPSPIVSSVAF